MSGTSQGSGSTAPHRVGRRGSAPRRDGPRGDAEDRRDARLQATDAAGLADAATAVASAWPKTSIWPTGRCRKPSSSRSGRPDAARAADRCAPSLARRLRQGEGAGAGRRAPGRRRRRVLFPRSRCLPSRVATNPQLDAPLQHADLGLRRGLRPCLARTGVVRMSGLRPDRLRPRPHRQLPHLHRRRRAAPHAAPYVAGSRCTA